MGRLDNLDPEHNGVSIEEVVARSRAAKKLKPAVDSRSFKEACDGSSGDSFSDDVEMKGSSKGGSQKEGNIVVTKVGEWDCVMLSPEFKNRLRSRYARAVIVKVLGRNFSSVFLERKVREIWAPKGEMEMVELGEGFFLVKFGCEEDLATALEEGPWLIFGHYLTVRRWVPDFHPSAVEMGATAVWIRLPSLSHEYYDEEVLVALGERVGKVRKVDAHTRLAMKAKFARICVEVDLSLPLRSQFFLREVGRKSNSRD